MGGGKNTIDGQNEDLLESNLTENDKWKIIFTNKSIKEFNRIHTTNHQNTAINKVSRIIDKNSDLSESFEELSEKINNFFYNLDPENFFSSEEKDYFEEFFKIDFFKERIFKFLSKQIPLNKWFDLENFDMVRLLYLLPCENSYKNPDSERLNIFEKSISTFQWRDLLNKYISELLPKVIWNAMSNNFQYISYLSYLITYPEFRGNKELENPKTIIEQLNLNKDTSIENLWHILEHYILELEFAYAEWNEEKVKIYSDVFYSILELANKFWILNEVDYSKRDFIKKLSSTLINKINKVTSNSELGFSKTLINKISDIKWKLICNFWLDKKSSIKDICKNDEDLDIDPEKLNKFYLEILESIEKHIVWYETSKDSNFWDNPSRKPITSMVFLGNMSKYLLEKNKFLSDNWIDFLESIENDYYKASIFKFYKSVEDVLWKELKESSWNILDLLNNVHLYINEWKLDKLTAEKRDIEKDLIRTFINWNEIEENSMEAIYTVVSNNNISKSVLIELWEYLIQIDKFESYKNEYLKLEILDHILFTLWDELDVNFLKKIKKYTEKNMMGSQILPSYSKIFFALSYVYSLNIQKNIYEVENLYYLFTRTWALISTLEQSKYYKLLENYWKTIWLNWLSSKDFYLIWEKLINWENWIVKLKDSERNNIFKDKIVNMFFEKKTTDNVLNLDIPEELSDYISSEIFSWIVDVNILIKWKKSSNIKDWISSKTIELEKSPYQIEYNYPDTYSEIFENILENSEDSYLNLIDLILNEYSKKLEMLKYEDIISDLEEWIEDWRFHTVYQPITNFWDPSVDFTELLWNKPKIDNPEIKWEIIKYEALFRIDQNKGKKLNIQDYLDASKILWKTHLITNAMIDNIIKFYKKSWIDSSINLFTEDLLSDDFIKYLIKIKENEEIIPEKLTFEILESKWPDEEYDKILENLSKIKSLWFKLSIDDLWADSSNFSRAEKLFKNWLADYIKIDSWIIRKLEQYSNDSIRKELINSDWTVPLNINKLISDKNIERETEKKSAITNIEWAVKQAKNYSKEWWEPILVVSEYVENDYVFAILKKCWVDLCQWYYNWNKPKKEEEILSENIKNWL